MIGVDGEALDEGCPRGLEVAVLVGEPPAPPHSAGTSMRGGVLSVALALGRLRLGARVFVVQGFEHDHRLGHRHRSCDRLRWRRRGGRHGRWRLGLTRRHGFRSDRRGLGAGPIHHRARHHGRGCGKGGHHRPPSPTTRSCRRLVGCPRGGVQHQHRRVPRAPVQPREQIRRQRLAPLAVLDALADLRERGFGIRLFGQRGQPPGELELILLHCVPPR